MFCKLDKQAYMSEFESHWRPLSFDLVPHRSKELRKLLNYYIVPYNDSNESLYKLIYSLVI